MLTLSVLFETQAALIYGMDCRSLRVASMRAISTLHVVVCVQDLSLHFSTKPSIACLIEIGGPGALSVNATACNAASSSSSVATSANAAAPEMSVICVVVFIHTE